jgi:hypothetical protein
MGGLKIAAIMPFRQLSIFVKIFAGQFSWQGQSRLCTMLTL